MQLVQHLVFLPLLLHHLLLLPLPGKSYRLSHTPQKWSPVYLNGYESPIMNAEEGFMDEEGQVGSSWCGRVGCIKDHFRLRLHQNSDVSFCLGKHSVY